MSKRALVIDDSRAMRRILGKILKDLGFEVFEAGDGQEALERLDDLGEVRLVLVDWNMPVMNGYEFVVAARKRPELDAVPFVMVTTETEMSNVVQALEAGANEYVMKPFTKEIILDKLALLNMVDG